MFLCALSVVVLGFSFGFAFGWRRHSFSFCGTTAGGPHNTLILYRRLLNIICDHMMSMIMIISHSHLCLIFFSFLERFLCLELAKSCKQFCVNVGRVALGMYTCRRMLICVLQISLEEIPNVRKYEARYNKPGIKTCLKQNSFLWDELNAIVTIVTKTEICLQRNVYVKLNFILNFIEKLFYLLTICTNNNSF